MKYSICPRSSTAVAAVTVAFAVSNPPNVSTPQRVAEVNALSENADPAHVTVNISGISKVTTAPDGHKAVLEVIRELRYPTA